MAERKLPQFEPVYDVHKMRVLVDILEKNIKSIFSLINNLETSSKSLTTSAGSYVLLPNDERIEFTNSGPCLATLINPTGISGYEFSIINHYNSTNAITFNYPISGDLSFSLLVGESMTIYSNGTEYMVD